MEIIKMVLKLLIFNFVLLAQYFFLLNVYTNEKSVVKALISWAHNIFIILLLLVINLHIFSHINRHSVPSWLSYSPHSEIKYDIALLHTYTWTHYIKIMNMKMKSLCYQEMFEESILCVFFMKNIYVESYHYHNPSTTTDRIFY